MVCTARFKTWFPAAAAALLITVAPHAMAADADQANRSRNAAERPAQASLQAGASTRVAHDTVRITLAAEVSGDSQDDVSRDLSATMNRAMVTARKNAGDIDVASGNYRVWPMNDKKGQISNWRGRGEIWIESRDLDAASRLAAELSDGLAISSLTFFVSPSERAAQEEKLLDQAVDAFRARAKALSKALGYARYRINRIDLSGSGLVTESAPRFAQAALKASADAVPLEPGTETITVTVQGSIWLLDEKPTKAQ